MKPSSFSPTSWSSGRSPLQICRIISCISSRKKKATASWSAFGSLNEFSGYLHMQMRVNCNQPCQALHERRQNREALLFFFWEQINKMSFKMKSDSCNRCVKVLFIHAPHEVNSIIVLCQCRLSIVSKTAHYLKTMFSRIIVNVNSAHCVEVSSFYSVWCILRAD